MAPLLCWSTAPGCGVCLRQVKYPVTLYWRKLFVSPQQVTTVNNFLTRTGTLRLSPPQCLDFDWSLCRSCVCQYCLCEFIRASLWLCPDDNLSLMLSTTSVSYTLSPLLHRPLSLGKMALIKASQLGPRAPKISHPLETVQLWVCVLTAIYCIRKLL